MCAQLSTFLFLSFAYFSLFPIFLPSIFLSLPYSSLFPVPLSFLFLSSLFLSVPYFSLFSIPLSSLFLSRSYFFHVPNHLSSLFFSLPYFACSIIFSLPYFTLFRISLFHIIYSPSPPYFSLSSLFLSPSSQTFSML